MTKPFSTADRELLYRAIERADEWRGSLHPDDWHDFDQEIEAMHRALTRAWATREQLMERKIVTSRRLKNGESRVMRSRLQPERVKVTAFCEDADTPYVILTLDNTSVYLENMTAQDLVERISRALSILPTSK